MNNYEQKVKKIKEDLFQIKESIANIEKKVKQQEEAINLIDVCSKNLIKETELILKKKEKIEMLEKITQIAFPSGKIPNILNKS